MIFYIACFIVGYVLGTIVTNVIRNKKIGYGKFSVEPVDEESGVYSVNISLPKNMEITKKDTIVLTKSSRVTNNAYNENLN